MILLTAFFPTTPEREAELLHCIEHNLAQPFFSGVVLLCEGGVTPKIAHPKLYCVTVLERPVYGDFFERANIYHPGQICVVSNTDVMYDDSLVLFETLPPERWHNQLFAITRTNENGQLQNTGSQDTWVFKAPLQVFDGWGLILGIIGCDSFLAQKAIEAGIQVENPAISVHCLHRHRVGIHNDMLTVPGKAEKTCYWYAPGYRAFCVPYSSL